MHASASPAPLTAASLRQLALDCGADDAGCISINRAELDNQRAEILRCFPPTRTLLSVVCRMNREPIRSVDRSVANLEFHESTTHTNEVTRAVVAALERRGVRALNSPAGFPMETQNWGGRMWIVSHKPVAVAAGLGQMGIHRNVIHPQFGSFILLGTVLIGADLDAEAKAIDFNPCLGCKLCVAACPVGAIAPDGAFDFSACNHHNYREFMSGFTEWVDHLVESRNRADYRSRVTAAETVSLWQSLGFGPNYKAAYCLAVCPAGTDVVAAYRENKGRHVRELVKPLQEKVEPVYVIRGSDAEAYVKKRFPHKRVRPARSALLPRSIRGFLGGMPLGFQKNRAAGLEATLHFRLREKEGGATVDATVDIRGQKLAVRDGLHGTPQVTVDADGETWLAYLRGERGIVGALLTRKIKVKGSVAVLRAFGRCFPK